VPVVVRELTDEQVLEIQIIENEKRKDIHALEQSDAFVAWSS
jgi:ParB-like chromosome segregation protein Spo0J